LARVLNEDCEIGGTYTETTGSQGSGKTAVNLAFLKHYTTAYPQDKCFWSSTYDTPLQFTKLGTGTYHIMILRGSNVIIYDREKEVEVKFPNEYCPYPITYFDTYEELWNKAMPGKCNAVFFGKRTFWMDCLHYMKTKLAWAHIFFDEFGEIASSDSSGKDWKKVRKFSEEIKEFRKCNKNIHTNTQSVTDIDYRVRRKLMIRIFLSGAKADSKTRVYQRAIDGLKKDKVNGNNAYIDYDGKFGIVRFGNIFKPIPGMNWDARVITPGDEEFGRKRILETRTHDTSGHTESPEGPDGLDKSETEVSIFN
jgi:hypothetical protein